MHTHHMKSPWKFRREAKLEFPEGWWGGGGGAQTKKTSVGDGYGYFLEPRISSTDSITEKHCSDSVPYLPRFDSKSTK